MDVATRERLHDLIPEGNGDHWTSIFIGVVAGLAAAVAGLKSGVFLVGLGGALITFVIRQTVLKPKSRFEQHLERLSLLPFEVRGYLGELVRYDEHKPEFVRSGNRLATHVTIRFTQPVAEKASTAKAFDALPNGAEVQIADANTLLYIQHKLMIIGERWDDPRIETNPFKMIAGAADYYNRERRYYYGGPAAEFRKRLPLQRWFMNLIGTRLEPLHNEYPIAALSLRLVIEELDS